jgi:DNA-binding response OmpR family regulator
MNKKILLADSSPTIQRVVELTFSTQGYEVQCVGSASDVLAQTRSARPDVVLLDIGLPGESGYDLCRRLKQESEVGTIPVMLLTGTFEPFDAHRARDAGAADHLTKPFESQVLVERVAELIRNPAQSRIPKPRVEAAVIRPEPVVEAVRQEPAPAPPAVETVREEQAPPEPEASASQPTADMMESIIQQVVERLSDDVVREVAWEVVPDLAERLVRQRIRQIEEEAG